MKIRLRFECRKCGFKDTYEIKNEADMEMAGTAFGRRHGTAHPEMFNEVRKAKLEVVARYVKILDDDTGAEIPFDHMIGKIG